MTHTGDRPGKGEPAETPLQPGTDRGDDCRHRSRCSPPSGTAGRRRGRARSAGPRPAAISSASLGVARQADLARQHIGGAERQHARAARPAAPTASPFATALIVPSPPAATTMSNPARPRAPAARRRRPHGRPIAPQRHSRAAPARRRSGRAAPRRPHPSGRRIDDDQRPAPRRTGRSFGDRFSRTPPSGRRRRRLRRRSRRQTTIPASAAPRAGCGGWRR